MLPLVVLGTRHSRTLLALLKRPLGAGPVRADTRSVPIIEGCYAAPQVTESLHIILLTLAYARHYYPMICERRHPVNHCPAAIVG